MQQLTEGLALLHMRLTKAGVIKPDEEPLGEPPPIEVLK
jgi:hypothetical protein